MPSAGVSDAYFQSAWMKMSVWVPQGLGWFVWFGGLRVGISRLVLVLGLFLFHQMIS